MTLVLYDMLLNLKYPIPEKDVIIYGKEGGRECDVIIGSNQYDQTRTIDAEEKIVMNFVLGSISHEHFAIDRRGAHGPNPAMTVKDLSRNGTYVSRQGGEYQKAEHVTGGNFNAVAGQPIQFGSRIRLGASSDHVLEVMTDDAASELIQMFVVVRASIDEKPEPQKPKKKKGFLGLFGR